MTERIVAPPAQLAATFRRRFETSAGEAMRARGGFTCALPGGSAAETLLPALVGAAVDWRRIQLFWVDERAVPPDDPQSNYGAAWRLWLQYIDVETSHVHRIHAEDADLDRATADYQATLTHLVGTPPAIDLILLGLGPDGHVCSLFPGHTATRERTRFAVAVRDAPKPPPARITVTLPVIAAAGSIVLAAFGAEKADAVRDALEDAASDCPAARALRSGPPALVLLDPAAASRLKPTI